MSIAQNACRQCSSSLMHGRSPYLWRHVGCVVEWSFFFLLRCRSVCSSLQSLDLGFYIRRASLRGVCFHGANTVKGSDCKGGCCWEVGCCEQHVPKCCSSGACMFVPYRENACGNALSNDEDSPSQKGRIEVVRQRHFAQATNGPYCYGFVSTYARSRVSFHCSRISVRG